MSFLKSAAEIEQFAMGLLSRAYSAGRMAPRDDRLALAYSVAEATLRGLSVSPPLLQIHFGKRMSNAEFNDAMQLGVQPGQKCCKQ